MTFTKIIPDLQQLYLLCSHILFLKHLNFEPAHPCRIVVIHPQGRVFEHICDRLIPALWFPFLNVYACFFFSFFLRQTFRIGLPILQANSKQVPPLKRRHAAPHQRWHAPPRWSASPVSGEELRVWRSGSRSRQRRVPRIPRSSDTWLELLPRQWRWWWRRL